MNKKIVYLWGLLVFLIGVSIITNEYYNSGNSEDRATKNDIIEEDKNYFDLKHPKKAAYAHNREWIHIDGSDPNNWSDTAAAYEWCYVENNYYVIENVTIDATNSPLLGGIGIFIRNSINDYFIIRNCTIANSSASFLYGAITLENTNNGTIIDNKLIDNQYGIVLYTASNNTIVNNTIESKEYGISIIGGLPPFFECYDNYLSNNNMSNCGIEIGGTLLESISNTIETSNTVNEKPVYYYVNESGLMPINFTNAGQIILHYCNHSEILDVDTSYGSNGIYIIEGFNITISHSNITHNNLDGLYIFGSENITVDNCKMIENGYNGLLLYQSNYCNISLNYYECNSIGTYLASSYNITFKNNTMVRTGVSISFSAIDPIPDYIIDTSNTVNGKSIYCYQNKNYLTSANFSNPGQIILINCNKSVITNFNISSGSYGILVYYSNNLTLSNINVSSHKRSGINIHDSNNVTISYTNAENCDIGLRLYEGKDITISNNTFSHNDDDGLYINDCSNSLLFNNTIENNGNNGLYLTSSDDINITRSIISNNSEVGIFLHYGFDCIITMNTILNNSREGIDIQGGDNSIFTMNDIINNSRYGIYISDEWAENNLIFNNTFITNGVQNAYDAYGNNFWYNDSLGNSWDDYSGTDADDDGIGDSPYVINPGPLVQDERPIFLDAPKFIVFPAPYFLYGNNSPFYIVSIIEGIEDTVWYTLDNDPTMYNITGILSGYINQTGWDKFDNGTVIIHFYVNDSRGYIGNKDIPVLKDCIAPNITIIEPRYNKLFNGTAPFYNLTFIDAHLDDTWYRLWNGTEWSINYTIPGLGSERTGQINQDAWNDCPNGTVIIEFYANDTLGNLRRNSTTVRKDILGPLITIYDPTPNELFFSIAPNIADCNVTFIDVSGIAARWYMLINGTDNTDYTNNYSWNDEVDQFVWDYMDNGTVIIRIFANDSLGNIGMAEVTVRKDIQLPGNGVIYGWIWMSGNKTIDEYGVYGTKGVPDMANYPGARSYSVSWTDTDGNLWLFGGSGYNESGVGSLNDLWRFNISSKEWAWMSGNKTTDEYGVYGTKGIPNRANYPGARYGSVSWTDTDGNLWLFGGSGYAESSGGVLNDLWRFNITSKEWAWMSGNKTIWEHGIYGTKGDPDMANYPGGRAYSVSWTDTDGNLWLFGGWGLAESDAIWWLNDLWRFNITSKEWAWMSGSKNQGVFGVYGTKGVPDMANYPGARYCSVSWTDTDGNLWLFGGCGWEVLNDLWRFNITSKEWAWMSGNKTTNEYGVYGMKGVPDRANYPGARYGSVSWMDTVGNLWLFGGSGYPESGAIWWLNDLWRFNITSKEWAWMSGTRTADEYGVYGTKGVPDMANYPGARAGSVSWTDTDGNLWLFGGSGYPESGGPGLLNDLWKYKDFIAPNITIIEPIVNQSVYSSPPEFIIIVVETNKDTMWYRLFNGTHYTENRTFISNNKIDEEDWKAMWNFIDYGEIIWIIFYCNDTAGNIGFANVTVIKSQVPSDGVLPPDGDDDDDGKKAKEGFDIALLALIIIGVSLGAAVAGIIFIKKKIAGKKRIKEIRRIERLGRE